MSDLVDSTPIKMPSTTASQRPQYPNHYQPPAQPVYGSSGAFGPMLDWAMQDGPVQQKLWTCIYILLLFLVYRILKFWWSRRQSASSQAQAPKKLN